MTWMTPDYSLITSNNNVMVDNPRISLPDNTTSNYGLTIKHIRATDAGDYTCMLQTFPPQMKNIKLDVFGKICKYMFFCVKLSCFA